MNSKNIIIYVDMDGVLCDFHEAINSHPQRKLFPGRPDLLPNIFKDLKLIYGAKEGFNYLIEKFDTYILSSPSWDNYNSWTHKRLWVEKFLGDKARKKLILSHNKNLQIGHYLIDDNPRNGAKDFTGKWLQFGSEQYPNWKAIINYFSNKY